MHQNVTTAIIILIFSTLPLFASNISEEEQKDKDALQACAYYHQFKLRDEDYEKTKAQYADLNTDIENHQKICTRCSPTSEQNSDLKIMNPFCSTFQSVKDSYTTCATELEDASKRRTDALVTLGNCTHWWNCLGRNLRLDDIVDMINLATFGKNM
jgi:hypothetical protein